MSNFCALNFCLLTIMAAPPRLFCLWMGGIEWLNIIDATMIFQQSVNVQKAFQVFFFIPIHSFFKVPPTIFVLPPNGIKSKGFSLGNNTYSLISKAQFRSCSDISDIEIKPNHTKKSIQNTFHLLFFETWVTLQSSQYIISLLYTHLKHQNPT